jgi:hypothetical protein
MPKKAILESPFSGTTSPYEVVDKEPFSSAACQLEYKMANKSVPHTYTRNGVFYFIRRIPRSLHGSCSKRRIIFSLKTRCPIVAENRVKKLIVKLEDYWFALRLQTDPDLGGHLGIHPAANTSVQPTVTTADKHDVRQVKSPVAPKITKAAETYLRLKGRDRTATFHRSVQRNVQYFTTVCGDKNINEYQKVVYAPLRGIIQS